MAKSDIALDVADWFSESILGIWPYRRAAAHLRVTRVTLSRVLNGKAGISAAVGDPVGGGARYDARTVDEYAVAV